MPPEADGLPLLLEDEGLLLEPMVLDEPPDDPMVLAPVAEPMVLLSGLDDALELPLLRQGVVLPELDAPMPLVPESVLDPVLEPVVDPVLGLVLELAPGPELELLDEDCACTANEATATAALAARTASLWVLVMSEVLWLIHVRTRSRPGAAALRWRRLRQGRRNATPGRGAFPHDCGNGCSRQDGAAGACRGSSARRAAAR